MFRKLIKALIPRDLFRSIEPYGHLVEAMVFNMWNGFPARGMKVIGVTGTNGKTTTSFMIHRMLHEAGYKVGMMTTVAYGAGMDIKPQMTHMTTSSAPVVFRRIKALRAAGVEWLVLETTSHALAQNRVWGIPFSIAVFTNLTHEHLAYHGTFERYRQAKVKLFRQTAASAGGLRLGIVNADDPSAPYFAAAAPRVLRYGVRQAQVELQATGVTSTPRGNEYEVAYEGQKLHIKTGLPGSFNVYNSLAAVAVGLALKLRPAQIEQGIAALEGVEGRMTRIDEGQDFAAIVDYAHSPDSFEKLFGDLKPMVKGKLIAVFGSQGTTGDVGKRAIQGRLAAEYADEMVVTEEDDRQEDGVAIMEEIAAAAEKVGKVRDKNLWLVHDRTKAIEFAVARARSGDTVLFLGKGHEKTIERGDGEHPWDEAGVVRGALRGRTGTQ